MRGGGRYCNVLESVRLDSKSKLLKLDSKSVLDSITLMQFC
ncbi:hypothetical protein [uncultured Helicobacter sp.]